MGRIVLNKPVGTFALKILLMSSFAFSSYAEQLQPEGFNDTRLKAKAIINLASQVGQLSLSDQAIKNMGTKIQGFLANPKHKSVLDKPEGKELRDIQVRLGRYLLTKNKLSKCVQDHTSKQELTDRIGTGILNSQDCKSDLSTVGLSKINSFDEVLAKLDSEEDSKVETKDWQKTIDFRNKALGQGYEDALKTYIDLQYRYQPGLGKINVEHVFNDLFEMNGMNVPGANKPSRFDSAVKFDIIDHAKNYLKKLEENVKPVSLEDTRKFLNTKIAEMAESYKKVPARPFDGKKTVAGQFSYAPTRVNSQGEAWGAADQKDYEAKDKVYKESLSSFNNWAGKHLSETIKNPAGTLLFTKTASKYFVPNIKNKDADSSGGLRTFLLGETQAKFTQIPNTKEIEASIKDAKAQVLSYGQYLSKMNFSKTVFSSSNIDIATVKDHLASLASSAPATLSQVLINHPEYTGFVCDAVNLSHKKELKEKKKEELYLYGGMIVGGGLMISGVGSGIGAAVLEGTATGALLATVASTTAIMGSAASLFEIAHLSEKSHKLIQDHNQLKSALFATGSTDMKGWLQAQKLMEEFDEANFNMALSTGFLVVDAATLGATFKGLTQIQKYKALKDTTALLKKIDKNPEHLDLLSKIKNIFDKEEVSELMTKIAAGNQSDEAVSKALKKALNVTETTETTKKLMLNIQKSMSKTNDELGKKSLRELAEEKELAKVTTHSDMWAHGIWEKNPRGIILEGREAWIRLKTRKGVEVPPALEVDGVIHGKIIEQFPMGVVVKDSDGRFHRLNANDYDFGEFYVTNKGDLPSFKPITVPDELIKTINADFESAIAAKDIEKALIANKKFQELYDKFFVNANFETQSAASYFINRLTEFMNSARKKLKPFLVEELEKNFISSDSYLILEKFGMKPVRINADGVVYEPSWGNSIILPPANGTQTYKFSEKERLAIVNAFKNFKSYDYQDAIKLKVAVEKAKVSFNNVDGAKTLKDLGYNLSTESSVNDVYEHIETMSRITLPKAEPGLSPYVLNENQRLELVNALQTAEDVKIVRLVDPKKLTESLKQIETSFNTVDGIQVLGELGYRSRTQTPEGELFSHVTDLNVIILPKPDPGKASYVLNDHERKAIAEAIRSRDDLQIINFSYPLKKSADELFGKFNTALESKNLSDARTYFFELRELRNSLEATRPGQIRDEHLVKVTSLIKTSYEKIKPAMLDELKKDLKKTFNGFILQEYGLKFTQNGPNFANFTSPRGNTISLTLYTPTSLYKDYAFTPEEVSAIIDAVKNDKSYTLKSFKP